MSLIKKLLGNNRPSNKETKSRNAPGSKSKSCKCPYCGTLLEKKPARKKKCSNCGNYIFVRKGRLLTEDQKAVEEWLDSLAMFDVTEQTFNRHRKQLSKQFGSQPSVNDTVWRVLNSLVASTTDHSRAKLIYSEMAHLVRGEGKDPKPYLAKAAKQELLDMKESGISRVCVYTSNDDLVCSKCRALARKTFTIDQALRDMPIPNACDNDEDGCRCWYSAVVDF